MYVMLCLGVAFVYFQVGVGGGHLPCKHAAGHAAPVLSMQCPALRCPCRCAHVLPDLGKTLALLAACCAALSHLVRAQLPCLCCAAAAYRVCCRARTPAPQLDDAWKDVYSRAALLFFVVAFLTFMSIAAFPAFIEGEGGSMGQEGHTGRTT